MRVEFSDMTEFIRRMESNIFDEEEFKRAMEYVSAQFCEGEDYNEPEKDAHGNNWTRVGDIGPDVSDCKELDGGESSS